MKNTMTPTVLSALFEQLSLLLHAGAQPEAAIHLLCEAGQDCQYAPALLPVRDRMLQGAGFAAAVSDCGLFPAYATGLLAVGEASGRLEGCLSTLAGYYARQVELRERLKNALLYPTALLLMMSAVLAVLVFAVLPVFTRVYESLAGSLVGSSYAYVAAAGVIGRAALVLTVLLCAAALLAAAGSGSAAFSRRVRALLERLPGTGSALRLLAVSRLCDILATLLASGMDQDSALDTAISMNQNMALAAQLSACRDALRTGTGLATALCAQSVFSPLHRCLLTAGAASGKLPEVFSRLAEQTGRDGQAALQRRIDLSEPVLTVFLTATVGLTLLSAMLPLVGILGSIG
ncbi:MAG: type II secretion system F family protein [Oscillospiraceae bacterium]|nr:type II secretion system F family protein [Oscillospiraceae bacterium]